MKRTVLMLAVLTAAANLSGCAALVVGGAAAGGYYVGKDSRSAGRIADDAAITTRINARYVDDPLVSAMDVDVDTYNGVVTLTGVVHSERARVRAVELARTVKGVRKVESHLRIVP